MYLFDKKIYKLSYLKNIIKTENIKIKSIKDNLNNIEIDCTKESFLSIVDAYIYIINEGK